MKTATMVRIYFVALIESCCCPVWARFLILHSSTNTRTEKSIIKTSGTNERTIVIILAPVMLSTLGLSFVGPYMVSMHNEPENTESLIIDMVIVNMKTKPSARLVFVAITLPA